jgi:hypothetical protein
MTILFFLYLTLPSVFTLAALATVFVRRVHRSPSGLEVTCFFIQGSHLALQVYGFTNVRDHEDLAFIFLNGPALSTASLIVMVVYIVKTLTDGRRI